MSSTPLPSSSLVAPPAPLDVLVVEDDRMFRELLAYHLHAQGWTVRTAADGDEALAVCAERRPDVVVLDVMLPALGGYEACATLRRLYDPSPGVVMLTARTDEADTVMGLEVGADDYVVKPCRPREIVARIRALSRRIAPRVTDATATAPSELPAGETPPAPDGEVLERGRLRVDPRARRVTVDGRGVRLTPTEFALLAFLARAPARVYSRTELLERVWSSTRRGDGRNVDCHVTRLRRKLELAGLVPAPIEASHGAGYAFVLAPVS
jgi:DNA-binding response OmpR family regulator